MIPTSLFLLFVCSWMYLFDIQACYWKCMVLYHVLHKHNRVPQPCLQMYSHTWWWTEWPDFMYPQRHLCRWRSVMHQASISLLLQPVMESILPLDVLSIGKESEKVLWFNLLCFSFSFSISIWEQIYLSIHIFCHPFSSSSLEISSLSSLSHADFLSASLCLFISLCLLLPLSRSHSLSFSPSHPPVLVARQLLELRDYD